MQAAATPSFGVVLTAVSTEFDDITGIAAHEPTNELVIAGGAAGHDFELIAGDGRHRPFSSATGLVNDATIAAAIGDGGPFPAGELFAPAGNKIIRVAANGATVQAAWVTLEGETTIAALTVDRTGVFGGEVIAVTSAGNIWRINGAGVATRITALGVPLACVTIIPNDPDREGPWAGRILAGAATQPVLYAVDANGVTTAHQTSVVPRDLAVVTAHQNFFGVDGGDGKVWGARAEAFAGMVGDVIIAQGAPGALVRMHWNGTAFDATEIARVAQWQQITFSPAGVVEVPTATRPYDRIAVVRHAPSISSGRIEGALWQLAPETVTLDGSDVITSDLLVPGTPGVVVSGSSSFGGTVEGNGAHTPSTYSVNIGGNATLGHLITRTDPMTLAAIAPFTPTTNTRDASLTSASDSAGDFTTLRHLTISGKAGAVALPPGRYGRLSASGRTSFVLGVAGATQAASYEIESLNLSGGSELRLAGPVTLTVNDGATLTGSTTGSAEGPGQLVMRVAGGGVRVAGNAVLYAIVRAPQSTVTIDGGGRLRGTVSCDRLDISGLLQLTETDLPPPPVNRPPSVDAGADTSVTLPDAALLPGTVADDGLPGGATVAQTWTKVSGPGEVTFEDPSAAATSATFTTAGTYVLRLTADDSLLRVSDDVTVIVKPRNAAPVANAGADLSIALPAVASLNGSYEDDGLPQGLVTGKWTFASGPGSVTFGDENALVTTAAFSAAGTYALLLTINDGELSSSDELTVTVDPQNAAPVVSAGEDQTIDFPATAALAGEATDDGYPRDSHLTTTWSHVSGPAETMFADASSRETTATFSIAGTYTLRLTATDGALSTTDEVTVEVRDPNVAPAVDAGPDQTVRLPNTASLAGNVHDDSTPQGSTLQVTWTATGPAVVGFGDLHDPVTTATFHAAGIYVLRLTADDSKLQASDELTVTVLPANVAPTVTAGANQSIILPAGATLQGSATDDGVPSPLSYAWTRVSGPAAVIFSAPSQATTSVTFTIDGAYVLRLTASDGELSSSADVTITVGAANRAPVVDAGADRNVHVGEVATLAGDVTDDGLPASTLTYQWTRISGPATPSFGDATAVSTSVLFNTTGIYVLRLTVSDGELSGSDEVTIAVVRPPVADFTVPAISRNVARWKNNLASTLAGATIVAETSNDSSNVGAYMIDDNPYTRWRSGSGQTQNQSLTIRLGGEGTRPFDRIRITNDQGATEAVKNFRFEISTTTADAAAFTTVLTSFVDATRGIQEFPLDAAVTARYVRFVFVDNYGATNMAVRDVEVVATNGSGLDRIGALNVADSGQAAAVVDSSPWVRNPILALDGNLGTWWHASTVTNAFMTVRLVQESRIDRVRLVSGTADGARPRDFTIEVAGVPEGPYTKVLTATLANQDGWQEFALPGGAVRARFVRLTIVNNYGSTSAIVLHDFAALSADRPSVSSMQSPYERPELAFDNNNQTHWASANGRVAGEFFIVHLTDDEPRLVDAVELQGVATSAANCIKDFDVLVSTTTDEDAAFQWVVSGTLDSQFNLVQRFEFPGGPTRARYVKLLVKSNGGGGSVMVPTFHVLTLDHGGNLLTVPIPSTRPVNLSPALVANGATVVASTGSGAASMLDYVSNSGWITSGLTNQFATIALGGDTPRSVSGVCIAPPTSSGGVQNFEVWVSSTTTDASAFTKVLSGAVTTELKIQNFLFPGGPVPVRYIKYVPLTRFGTTTTIHTNVFDVILPVHPGGAVAASSTHGYFFPEGATSAAANVNPWVSVTGANEWLTVALPGSATRPVYGVTIEPSSFAPKDFDILVSNTTPDEAAFTRVYSGTYSTSQKTHRFGRTYDAKYVRFFFKNGTPNGAQFNIGRVDVLTVPDTGGAVLGASAGLSDNSDPNLAIDVNPSAGAWAPGSFKTTDQTFTVALPGEKLWRIDHVALQQGTACCPTLAPRDFEIQVSAGDLSDASYVTVYRGTVTPDFSAEHCFFPAVSARAVRLLVRNNWGGTSFVVQNFWVFSPQVGPRTARFLDTSVPGARTIAAWSWTFGDGSTSTDRDPVHVFPAAGTYEVALTVTDSDGLTTRRSMQYTVFGDPNVDFAVAPASPAEVSVVLFTDSSTSPSGAIATSDWTFGDNSLPQLNQKAVTHTYPDSGDYVVRHTVSDIRGVTASATRTLRVANVPPIASAGPDLSVPWGEPWGATPLVSDISVTDRTSITCRWDFGDGTGADLTNCVKTAGVVHRFEAPGMFTATLTATDKDGGSTTDTLVATVTRRASLVTYSGVRGVAADGSVALGAVLRDRISGEPLGGTVTFDVDGQTVTATTDIAGRATASLVYTGTALQPVVTVTYAGDALYLGTTSTAKLSCPVNQQPLDVAFVIDLSASMEVALADVKVGLTKLIDSLTVGKDRVAVVSFVNGSHVWQPLTGDLELARKSMEGFTTTTGEGIAAGISTGTAQLTGPLRNPAARPVMVVLSDGIESPPTAVANEAKSKGITLVSVMWTHSSPSGYDTMFPIASSPSDFYEVTSSAELEPLFTALPGTLCVAANAAPVSSAGAAQTIALPETTVTLNGSVFDDGKPAGATITTTWTRVSGPGEIIFGSANALQTTATITVAGTYIARLTAFDGELYSHSDVAIVVKPENQPPTADAGPDLTGTMEVELLKNGGAEEPLVGGKLPSWTEMAGTWTATASGPSPLRGSRTFVSSGATAAEIIQDIDVSSLYPTIDSGAQTFELNAFVRVAGETPSDAAKIMIEYRGLNNGSQLRLTQSGDITTSHLWERINITEVPPTGTRIIRIHLIAARRSGSTNDVWFDAVSLRALGSAVVATQGQVTDDAQPANILRTGWIQTAGPATALIGDSTRPKAFITTRVPGTYTFRMTADDTARTASDEMSVTTLAGDAAPVVNAGANATVTLPSTGTLAATAVDESPSTLAWSWYLLSGPDAVIAQPHAATTEVTFSAAGTYLFRAYADDGERIGLGEVSVTVNPAAGNHAPVVDAGADLVVADPPGMAVLDGQVTDDGLPEEAALTYAWSTVTGPAAAQFETPSQLQTNVHFLATGTYTLRLSSSDTRLIGSDDIVVHVVTNQPPAVNAGDDVVFTDSQPIPRLIGQASDSEIPMGGALTYQWTRVSGPGDVTFATPTQLATSITLSAHGRHVFRLTATDGRLSASDDVVITWDGANTAPTVNAGADLTVTLPGTAALTATVDDDGLPVGGALSMGWSRVSGPADVTFANPGAATTDATFTVAGDYVLRITVTDGEATTSDDIAVTVKEPVPPSTVEITSPESGAVVTDRTMIAGTVSGAAQWRLDYRLNGNDSATGNPWTIIATGTGDITNGPLGVFDPTLLVNGTYKVRLTSENAVGVSSGTSISVVVDGELKVGVFTLSFVDVTVPLPGLSLQVVRTYDSRVKQTGDFGVGWSQSLTNVRLEKSGTLGTDWYQSATGVPPFIQYCIEPQQPRLVTVTFPDGKVYRFAAVTDPHCQLNAPIRTPSVTFVPVGRTRGTLVALGDTDVLANGSVPGPAQLVTFDLRPYDPQLFRLTLENGTVYDIHEAEGVQKITDRNGNVITVTSNGITHSKGHSVAFTRDASGRITRVTDPSGKSFTYGYDAAGDLVAVTDRESQTTDFVYDGRHNLLTMAGAGMTPPVRNEYDAEGRLIRQVDAQQRESLYSYDLDARRQTVTDRLGHTTTLEFDNRGNVLKSINALGRAHTYTYDDDGNRRTESDPLGNTSQYEYDDRGNRITVTTPAGNVSRFTYNVFGAPLTETDALSRTTTYTYDQAGNLLTTTDAIGNVTTVTYTADGQIETITDANQKTNRFEYDQRGFLQREIDASGKATSFRFDANGRRTAIVETLDTAPVTAARSVASLAVATVETQNEYDDEGRLTKTTAPDGATFTYVYNDRGLKSAEIDPLGRQTTYEYDDLSRLIRKVAPDLTEERYSYDAEDRQTSLTDRGGRVFTYTYDELGQLTKVSIPSGASTTATYDNIGRVITRTDPLGNVTRFEYDATCGCDDRLTKVIAPDGRATTITYDALGHRKTVTDAMGKTIAFEYDPVGRLHQVRQHDGTTRSVSYDATGRIGSYTDAAGRVTTYEYDERNNLTKVTNPLQETTSFVYDARGNILEQLNTNGRSTRYTYDVMGRRLTRTLPMGMSESYEYDPAGQIKKRIDFNGRTAAYEYDALGRITKLTPDAAFGHVPITYSYNAMGQRATMVDSLGTTTYAYDENHRLRTVTSALGTLTYTYDAADHVTSVRSSNTGGVWVEYGYDIRNRLATVTDRRSGDSVTTYTYDDVGNIQDYQYPNGTTTSFAFDDLHRLTGTTASRQGTIADYAYVLDVTGRRRSVTELNGRTATYDYDELGRLTGESITGEPLGRNGALSYTYDRAGNRATRVSTVTGIGDATHEYDDNDRLLPATFDANGNPLIEDTRTFAYDWSDRLISVDNGAIRATYDGDGNRVTKTVNGVTTYFLVDSNNPTGLPQVIEESRGGEVQRRYTYGIHLISQHQQIDETWLTSFYGYDGSGSVRYLTDAGGSVTDTYDYDAFGQLISSTGTTPNLYLYNGEQFDHDLQMYVLRARYMNPKSGRFLTMDPYEGNGYEPASLHKYAYANADPVNNSDPTGFETLVQQANAFSVHTALTATGRFAMKYYVQQWRRALLGGIGSAGIGALARGIDGGLGGLEEGTMYDDALSTTSASDMFTDFAIGTIVGPISTIRNVHRLLLAIGVPAAIAGIEDAREHGNRYQLAFRAVTAIAFMPYVMGKVRQHTGWLRLTSGVTAEVRGPTRNAYSVFFSVPMARKDWGKPETTHKRRGNRALKDAADTHPEFAAMCSAMGITPKCGTGTPPGWIWDHRNDPNRGPGVMQLVPSSQHNPSERAWWDLLHPNGIGGYAAWGVPNGAPPRRR